MEIKITSITPQQLKDGWIEDLESGRYVKITGHLSGKLNPGKEPENGRCCLGVLCDTALRLAPELEPFRREWGDEGYFDHEHQWLPHVIGDFIGLRPDGTRWEGEVRDFVPPTGRLNPGSLSEFNDFSDLTFTDIAQMVREQLILPE